MTQFALFIGINNYPTDTAIPPLRYARRDAVELYTLFKGRLGYGANTHLLDESPSALDVADTLDDLGKQVRSGDSFVLYFAGHGYQTAGDQFLLMPRARLEPLQDGNATGNDVISLNNVPNTIANWRGAVQSLILLDACRSALFKRGARDDGRMQAQVEAVLSGLAARELAKRRAATAPVADGAVAPRATILNACADGGQAYELEGRRRGIFSLSLQHRAEQAVQRGEPYLITPAEVKAMGADMLDCLPPAWRDRPQVPWLNPEAEPVLLWRPAPKPVVPPPAPPTLPPARTQPAGTSPDARLVDERRWRLTLIRAKTQGVKAYEQYLDEATAGAAHEAVRKLLPESMEG